MVLEIGLIPGFFAAPGRWVFGNQLAILYRVRRLTFKQSPASLEIFGQKEKTMNRLITVFSLISCATITAVWLVPTARADEWDKKTTITTNEPIEVNHKVLVPGVYVFKLLDSQSDRHIVQIFNENETKLFDTILAIPNYRLQPTGNSVFSFWETPAGSPPALRAWFYPGDNFGQEFLNSKPATQVATTQAVPVTYPQPTQEVMPPSKPVVAQNTPLPAPVTTFTQPEPAPARMTPPALEPQPTAPLVAQNERVLPQTASDYPAIALTGVFFLSLFALATLFGARRTH
jgi:hypothetical protein